MTRIEELQSKKRLTAKEKLELSQLKSESVSLGNSKKKESMFSIDKKQEKLEYINIYTIEPNPFQPRKHFREGEIEELAQSIKSRGKLDTPIVVTSLAKIYLGAGQKRLLAYKLLNKQEKEEGKEEFEMEFLRIPAFLAKIDDYTELSSLGLRENLARKNPFFLDTANALAAHFKILKEEDEKLSQNKFSEIAKKEFAIESKGTISKYLKIATLSELIQETVFKEKYNSFNGLYNLAKNEDGEDLQLKTLKQLVSGEIPATPLKEEGSENATIEGYQFEESEQKKEEGKEKSKTNNEESSLSTKKEKLDIEYVIATLKDIEVKDEKVDELLSYLVKFSKEKE